MEIDYPALREVARALRAAGGTLHAEGGTVQALESGTADVEDAARHAAVERARLLSDLTRVAHDQAQLCDETVETFRLLDAQVAWATEHARGAR